jgi:hypothetical protein
MCGSQKKPDMNLPTIPAPAPVATPADVSPVQTADQRRNKIAALKYGMSSTILNKGGARGITGNNADLVAPAGVGQKQKLGA